MPDQYHQTSPLSLAIRYGEPALARRLISHDPPASIDRLEGLIALNEAIRAKDSTTIELLLARGFTMRPLLDKELRYKGGVTVEITSELYEGLKEGNDLLVKTFLAAGANINQPVRKQRGQVIAGLVAADLTVLERALQLGADVDARLTSGGTSLHFYAGCSRCTDPITAMKNLIAHGADINALNSRGHTPLRRAEANGISDTRNFLQSLGATRRHTSE